VATQFETVILASENVL